MRNLDFFCCCLVMEILLKMLLKMLLNTPRSLFHFHCSVVKNEKNKVRVEEDKKYTRYSRNRPPSSSNHIPLHNILFLLLKCRHSLISQIQGISYDLLGCQANPLTDRDIYHKLARAQIFQQNKHSPEKWSACKTSIKIKSSFPTFST